MYRTFYLPILFSAFLQSQLCVYVQKDSKIQRFLQPFFRSNSYFLNLPSFASVIFYVLYLGFNLVLLRFIKYKFQ